VLLAITVPEMVRGLPQALQQPVPAWALATDPRLGSALVLVAVIPLTRHTLWGLLAGTAAYLLLWQLGG
jgi:branched-subunit amino acid transport protein